jgi:hypothetical protein
MALTVFYEGRDKYDTYFGALKTLLIPPMEAALKKH